MKTISNFKKNNIETSQNIIEGNQRLFLLLYKKINTFYEFDNNTYGKIFQDCIYKFNNIQNHYQEFLKNNNLELSNIIKKNIKLIGVGGYGQVYKIDDNFCIKINLLKHDEKIKDFNYHEYFIPKILSKKKYLKDCIIDPKILIKNNNFYGLINFLNINILFIYVTYCFIKSKDVNYEIIKKKIKKYDIENEYIYLFKNADDKIISNSLNFLNFLFIYFFKDNYYIYMIDNFLKILKYFKEYVDKEYFGYLLVMPLAECISTNIFLNENSLKINSDGLKAIYVQPHIYRMLFLQTCLFYLNANKKFLYNHNDLKPDNILVTKENEPYQISYNNLHFFFKENFRFKIADFDFSQILNKNTNNINDQTINKKIINSRLEKIKPWIIDIHFFVHKLAYYIETEEINKDKEFFLKIYELFIKPYCKINFTDIQLYIKVKNLKAKDICEKGFLHIKSNPDISILLNFLSSDYFSFWLCK